MSTLKEFDAKLQRHDWYWQYTDDAKVASNARRNEDELKKESELSHRHHRLFEAYSAAKSVKGNAELDQVRVEVGVITQAELDAIEEEKRLKVEREAKEKFAKLRQFDIDCELHNFFYWNSRLDTDAYRMGFDQRVRLTQRLELCYWGYKEGEMPYRKLFYAWAKFRQAWLKTARYDIPENKALNDVRIELGLTR